MRMTFDYELTLISERYEEDEIGNMVPVETKQVILCNIKSVKSSEFYNAANTGLKPEKVFVVHPFEYGDEKLIEFEGKKYSVIRTYQTGLEEIELTCERVIGNG